MTFLIPSPTGVTRGSMDTRVKHEPNRLTNVSEYKHLKNNKSKLNITKTQKKNWRRNRYPQPSIRERNNIIIWKLYAPHVHCSQQLRHESTSQEP